MFFRKMEVTSLDLTQELAVEEIFSKSFYLYKQNFLGFIIPYFFTSLLNSLLMVWVRSSLPPPPIITITTGPEMMIEWITRLVMILFVYASIGWIVSTVTLGYAVKYTSSIIEGEPVTSLEAFHKIIPKLPRLLAASFIADILIMIGILLFIVPGIICAVIFSLIAPTIILENCGILQSLSRSQRLVSKRWLKTFVLLLLAIIFIIVISSLGNLLDLLIGNLGFMASSIVTALIYPIPAIAITCLYYSMKVREKQRVEREKKQEESRSRILDKYCIRCGVALNHIAVYCPNCGARQPT
jgi:hypothetical protein